MTVSRPLLVIVALSVAQIAFADTTPLKMLVSSPTLQQDRPVPIVHTPDGRNESPAIHWSNVPAGVQEFAVICEDPGVGNPPPFVHWLIYNIPGAAKGLPAALPIDGSPMPSEIHGAVQGLSGFRRPIYRGPAPPPGKIHYYHFIVYALDTKIATKADQPPLTRAQLLEAMQGHVIGRGELVATYERN